MADLGAIDEDVKFGAADADTLITACRNAANTIDGQTGSRASWVTTGSTDFKGHFSELFATNAATAAGDAVELVLRLRQVATGAERLKEEAHKEQQRRETARKWKHDHDNRSLAEQGWDWLSGGDDPPVGPPAEEPVIPVDPAPNRPRQNPTSGGGGNTNGTSSARPSNLRTFATSSSGANDVVQIYLSAVKSAYTSFQGSCHYGSLDAAGVITGFGQWLTYNDQDVTWANAVAAAFAAAGGNGAVSTLSDSALSAALKAAGVGETRTDLTIPRPGLVGGPVTTGYADDPVNTATGNFVEPEFDLGFAGGAANLVLTRCYNSFSTAEDAPDAAFGPGWSSIAEAGLSFDDEQGQALVRHPDGRVSYFPRLGTGFGRAHGEASWLNQADGIWTVTGNDGSWWQFGADGRAIAYGSGPRAAQNAITLERDADGRLVRLVHARGRVLELTWDTVAGQARVVAATAVGLGSARYSYDDRARLIATTSSAGTRRYHWNDEQDVVDAVVDADGVVEVENIYDEQRRVVRQRSPYGRTTRFAYLPGRVTVVSDTDGTRSNTWIADDRGRLVGVVDADEQRQSMSYDGFSNKVLVTERNGDATVHEYDDRGRRVRTVIPSGAEVTYGYDEFDRTTIVVTEAGAVTTYRYEGDLRTPSAITDPEGGVTTLDWASGLLQRVVDPAGVEVSLGYDEHGDLIAVTDADGRTARTERDAAGRVIASVTPSGRRTVFGYDEHTGQLVTRQDPDGAVWRYEHTAAGRLAAVIDPMGGRTTIERAEHGEESRTVDPLGRAVERRLDDLGQLAEVKLPDGSTWQYAHDALARLTAVTDPNGAVWTRTYDAVGQVGATLDPTGVRVETTAGPDAFSRTDGTATQTTKFDPLGRITAMGQLDGSAQLYVYDRCGRPVESVDAEGGLTRFERDAAGRVVIVTGPTGATTRYRYDRCGRLVAVVDPVGGQTTIGYDADGRPATQTSPTGEVATTSYDVCGRVVEHRRPGIGRLSYTYDLAGRIVASYDPRVGERTFTYDAAGQLVAVTSGNGGTTRYDYDANGRATMITTPVGGIIRREFDGMNHCVAETDPLGRVTRAGYDGAGRQLWQTDPEGRRTTWTYDAAGRPLSMAVDGRTLSTIKRDLRARTVQITDTTGETPVEHLLEWNGRGQLVRRVRDGAELRWTYDAAGARTSMTTPDGKTTRYSCDAAGRLVAVEHPDLGRAAFDRDAAGRIVAAVANDILQSFEHHDGFVVGHTVTDAEGARRTVVERDADGRITRIDRSDLGVTAYGYDGAHQLISARTVAGDQVSTQDFGYDLGGRLITERTASAAGQHDRQHVYDLAGQLLRSTDGVDRTVYDYDGAGRRIAQRGPHGQRTFAWSATGHLAAVTDGTNRTTLHTDATGELSRIGDTSFHYDTAAYAGAPVLVGDTAVLVAGPVTGIGTDWSAPGWRTSRTTGADPWSALTGTAGEGFALGAAGEVSVAGLELLGARAYDPASRGFLSTDPLAPLTGAGWAANPYSYAGNDPLHALDPRGLSPVTDAELQAYRDNNGLAGSAFGKWVGNNWEYIAGGAMVVAGAALTFTGVGGPAGMMLMSAGADTIIQKATTGEVNWGEVAVSGALGAWSGAGVAAKLVPRAAPWVQAGVAGIVSGAGNGAAGSAVTYMTGPGPHTVAGFVTSTAKGAGMGAVSGGVMGAAGHGLDQAGYRLLRHEVPAPTSVADEARSLLGHPGDTVVLGRQADTAVARDWENHVVLNTDNWSMELNDEFIHGTVDYQRPVYLASEPKGNLVQTEGAYAGQPTVFARELNMLHDAGYTRQGDYLMPPGS